MVGEKDDPYYYTSFTKTQYAGPDAHMAIIKLLRYLENKYFSAFELQDEGMYWETMDEKILRNQFLKYEFALNALTAALSNMKAIPGETPDSLAERIEGELNKRLKSGGS